MYHCVPNCVPNLKGQIWLANVVFSDLRIQSFTSETLCVFSSHFFTIKVHTHLIRTWKTVNIANPILSNEVIPRFGPAHFSAKIVVVKITVTPCYVTITDKYDLKLSEALSEGAWLPMHKLSCWTNKNQICSSCIMHWSKTNNSNLLFCYYILSFVSFLSLSLSIIS